MVQSKRSDRFRVLFSRFGDGPDCIALTQQILSVSRPGVNFNNEAFVWDELLVVARDDVANRASRLIHQQVLTQRATTPMANFEMTIETLLDDRVIEHWVCENCVFERVYYNQFNYGTTDPMTITMTIKSENIVQHHLA